MDKRAFLAIVLSVAILIAWQFIFSRRVAPPPKPPLSAPASPVTQGSTAQMAEGEPVEAAPEIQKMLEEQAGQPLRELKVASPLYTATVTNKGARLKSWLLAEYLDKQGQPLELVSRDSLNLECYPLSLQFEDEQLTRRVNDAMWRVEEAQTTADPARPAQIKMSYLDPSGLKFTKIFIFPADNYLPQVTVGLENHSSSKQQLKYYLTWNYGLGQETGEVNSYGYSGPVYLEGDSLLKPKVKDIKDHFKYQGAISWAGLQDTYFAAIFVPQEVTSEIRVQKDESGRISLGLAQPGVELAAGQQVSHKFGAYIGPQKVENLRLAGHDLERIVDYGWFGFMARPLKEALKFFNRFTGNYGVDIIMITVLFKLLFWPLTTSSFKSMQAMQQIQPKMQQLRKKYKDDPQQLNREIMDLYRKHKVNPLGGCMPMILQIPVFFALYKVLMASVELRHAHFLPFWITDLSVKDPVYILPILMGGSMFLQQKMTPATGDATQAKMMAFMPVIFTFMFLKFPSGLVLYWLVNNILTIGQQYMIQKKLAAQTQA